MFSLYLYKNIYIDRLLIYDFSGTIYLHKFLKIIILLFYRFVSYFELVQFEAKKKFINL